MYLKNLQNNLYLKWNHLLCEKIQHKKPATYMEITQGKFTFLAISIISFLGWILPLCLGNPTVNSGFMSSVTKFTNNKCLLNLNTAVGPIS